MTALRAVLPEYTDPEPLTLELDTIPHDLLGFARRWFGWTPRPAVQAATSDAVGK